MTGTENDILTGLRGEDVILIIGDTPITKTGSIWLPLAQLVVWTLFAKEAAKRNPDASRLKWSAEGFLKMAVMLGSEWCHNLAHLFVSNLIGKPMDEVRIQFGLPRCIYQDINDREVTPQQHVLRSLGGPVINLLLLPVTGLARYLTKPGSIAGETAKTAYQTNIFLSLVSLLPIPGIDGGPILKWSLVEKGYEYKEAEKVVQQVNGPLALLLGLFSSQAFFRKKILAGILSGMLGLISLSIFAGWLKEEDVSV
ncbi:MAG: hypothetical protein HQ574_08015 [Chloroflexi bacterium]|nr:hypothetical protein [Chloroflexota bacterium]